ncbi:hypothetical protein DFH06DRAFT_1427030 [Mycena polygramma]|nr:hypothetical protein DFH06DRAFT_1427030 [Mycena polygramma]
MKSDSLGFAFLPSCSHLLPSPTISAPTTVAIAMVHAGNLLRRDAVSDAETACASSSNTNDSCYPVALTKFVQGQDTAFIWNPTLAKFRKTNLVNITIYDGSDEWDGAIGSQNTILQYRNLVNPPSGAGLLKVPVNDSWWGEKGAIWAGNISYPFFWTIWGADEEDTFTVGRQPFFAAIQTTLPDSVRSTMLSTTTPLPTQSDVDAGSITGSITSGCRSSFFRRITELNPTL